MEAQRGESLPPVGNSVGDVVPSFQTVNRIGGGSLTGKLVLAEDWDSAEVNESIAREFEVSILE